MYIPTDLMMVEKLLIWWTAGLTHLHSVLYILNDFSTKYSPKEKSTIGRCVVLNFSFGLLRFCWECIFLIISIVIPLFINSTKKTMDLQGFKLLRCDGVEASDPPYRLVPTFPIVVQLVGGVCQSVQCRGKFPALLQHFSHLMFLRLDLRVR